MPSRRRPSRRRTKRRAKRRRASKKTIRRSRFGKVGNFTHLTQRLPPIASTYMIKPCTSFTNLFYNYDEDPAIRRVALNYVFRCNDVVNPICCNGDSVDSADANTWATSVGTAFRTSMQGLSRIAPLYHEHSVQKFYLSARLQYRCPNDDAVVNRGLFVAWRITDDAPISPDTSTDNTDLYDDIVGRRANGWRFKSLPQYSNRTVTKKVKLAIPIRKFYRYPVFTRDEQEQQTCKTVDTSPAGS